MHSKIKKGMWPNETLKKTMDIIERTHYLRRANKSRNIPMSSLAHHLKMEKLDPRRWCQEVCYIRSYNSDYMDINNVRMWIVH
jgi:hypothetical protein